MPAGLVSPEAFLLGFQMAAFLTVSSCGLSLYVCILGVSSSFHKDSSHINTLLTGKEIPRVCNYINLSNFKV